MRARTITMAAEEEVKIFLGSIVATELDKAPGVNVIPFGACAATYSPCVPLPLTWNAVKNDVVVHGAQPLLEDSQLPGSRGAPSVCF